mmetsp:Transcript_81038/g.235018  ORF Transcript_81038/g.235018 Transcript_81038/m.235018 type:complete len:302 (-) Transcript_81038:933-1838(-)
MSTRLPDGDDDASPPSLKDSRNAAWARTYSSKASEGHGNGRESGTAGRKPQRFSPSSATDPMARPTTSSFGPRSNNSPRSATGAFCWTSSPSARSCDSSGGNASSASTIRRKSEATASGGTSGLCGERRPPSSESTSSQAARPPQIEATKASPSRTSKRRHTSRRRATAGAATPWSPSATPWCPPATAADSKASTWPGALATHRRLQAPSSPSFSTTRASRQRRRSSAPSPCGTKRSKRRGPSGQRSSRPGSPGPPGPPGPPPRAPAASPHSMPSGHFATDAPSKTLPCSKAWASLSGRSR